MSEMVRMQVYRVGIDPQRQTPFVLLADDDIHRLLPIFIGPFEANAIATRLQNEEFPRPLTHDLLRSVIEALGAELERVAVTELREGTFYALLYLRAGDRIIEVDARPSDAIALALRAEAPIYVAEEVLAEAQILYDELRPPEEKQEESGRLRELFEDLPLSPELLEDEDFEEEDLGSEEE